MSGEMYGGPQEDGTHGGGDREPAYAPHDGSRAAGAPHGEVSFGASAGVRALARTLAPSVAPAPRPATP